MILKDYHPTHFSTAFPSLSSIMDVLGQAAAGCLSSALFAFDYGGTYGAAVGCVAGAATAPFDIDLAADLDQGKL